MGITDVESVVQVHLKSVAVPAKTILNEPQGEVGTVQEIHSHYPERVCPSMYNVGVFWREAVHRNSDQLELLGVFGSRDVRETMWVSRVSPDGERVEWWEPKVESLLEYA